MKRYEIINFLISKYNLKSYLEIGLDNPNLNYNKIYCDYKESCDPYINDEWDGKYKEIPEEIKNVLTYHMTSDDMFKINKKSYDIIFIDGYHEQIQVSKDIISSLKHLNKDGFIVVHDCLPPTEDAQKMPRNSVLWNGDVWKGVLELKKQGLSFDTVDCDFGCCIIPYQNSEKFTYLKNQSKLEWKDFSKESMNSISTHDFLMKY